MEKSDKLLIQILAAMSIKMRPCVLPPTFKSKSKLSTTKEMDPTVSQLSSTPHKTVGERKAPLT